MIQYQSIIKRQDLKTNRGLLYVFGDNEYRCGYGGQAGEMRGEVNACGIATLKSPGDFWTEDDVARQCAVIDHDIGKLLPWLLCGQTVVWPFDGIGTGIAQLQTRSPSTFKHLSARLDQLNRVRTDIVALRAAEKMPNLQRTRAVLSSLFVGPNMLNETCAFVETFDRPPVARMPEPERSAAPSGVAFPLDDDIPF